ncbi:beta-ketoacyl reductase [Streptomyces lasalocidi]
MTGKLAEADLRRIARSGLRPMATDDALALLDAALRSPEPYHAPADLDPAALRASDGSVPDLLGDLVPARTRRPATATATASTAPAEGELRARLAALAPDARRAAALDAVLTQAALVIGHDSPDSLDPEGGFLDSGFNSLTAVELRNRIGALAGVRLPATLMFDYPTPQRLAAHLLTRIAPEAQPPASPVLDQLDALEAQFTATALDSAVQERLRSQLSGLLARLDAAGTTADTALTPTPSAPGAAADEVSDDELRAFLAERPRRDLNRPARSGPGPTVRARLSRPPTHHRPPVTWMEQ